MPRQVKDFIEISDYTSLESLIGYLKTIRDNLPEGHDAELKIRGDDVFGRRLTITYFRDQTQTKRSSRPNIRCRERGRPGHRLLRRKLDEVPFGKKNGG